MARKVQRMRKIVIDESLNLLGISISNWKLSVLNLNNSCIYVFACFLPHFYCDNFSGVFFYEKC